MKQKLTEMFAMQKQLNDNTCGPNWETGLCAKTGKNIDWSNAVLVEAGELLDWLGFKHWKKQEVNLDEARMEIVDLIHFCISGSIAHFDNDAIDIICDHYDELDIDYYDNTISITKDIVLNTLKDNYLSATALCILAYKSLGESFDDMYKLYMLKNYLNLFRQENGYNDGTYIKEWTPMFANKQMEDNSILMHLAENEEPKEAMRLFANQYAYTTGQNVNIKWSKGDF